LPITPAATQKPPYRLPPPLRPSARPRPSSTTTTRSPSEADDNDVDIARPGDNEIPDSVNIREQAPPGINVNVPRVKEEQKSINSAKLNLGKQIQ
jgi:hypothetical protein